MKQRILPWCVVLSWMAVVPLPRAAFGQMDRTGQPNLTADKGKLRILQQNTEAGTEDFDLEPAGNGWVLRGETSIRVPGSPEMRSSGELRFLPDGTPQHYTWNAQTDKKASGSVEFSNGTAKTSITVAGSKQPVQQDFKFNSQRVAVLDNNLYEQYEILGRLYDWNSKGKQTFPVLIPQDATPGSIDVESLGPKVIDGSHLEALRVHTADLDIDCYFDAKLHLMRLEAPAAKVVITRE